MQTEEQQGLSFCPIEILLLRLGFFCCFVKLSSFTTMAETKGCAMCFKSPHLIATW